MENKVFFAKYEPKYPSLFRCKGRCNECSLEGKCMNNACEAPIQLLTEPEIVSLALPDPYPWKWVDSNISLDPLHDLPGRYGCAGCPLQSSSPFGCIGCTVPRTI